MCKYDIPARAISCQSNMCGQGGGGNPLVWLAKLNPFDKQRRDEEDEPRVERESYGHTAVSNTQLLRVSIVPYVLLLGFSRFR